MLPRVMQLIFFKIFSKNKNKNKNLEVSRPPQGAQGVAKTTLSGFGLS
jgi:hypothetical protein